MRFNIFSFLILSMTFNSLKAQNTIKPLRIGDSLPDLTISTLINCPPNTSLNINKLAENLLILDFWAPSCKTCIEVMPSMVALQKKIGREMTLLPVATYGSRKLISDFWHNNKILKHLDVTSVVEDTVLKSWFPHGSIPHEVWIFKNKVIAITDHEYVNELNIRKVLNGEVISWAAKNDFLKYDLRPPLFKPDTLQTHIEDIVKYSVISDYNRNVTSSPVSCPENLKRDSISKSITVNFFNKGILTSFLSEYIRVKPIDSLKIPAQRFLNNQILWKVANKSIYTYSKGRDMNQRDWVQRNGICYESRFPDNGQTDKEIHQHVLDDLNRLLGLNVQWISVQDTVYQIKRKTKSPKQLNDLLKVNNSISIYDFVIKLNEIETNPYVFYSIEDEQVRIPVVKELINTISDAQRVLDKYGFVIEKQVSAVDKLLFEEKDQGRVVNRRVQLEALNRKRQSPDTTDFLTSNNVKITASGIHYKVLKSGRGETLKPSDMVVVDYEGRIYKGNIFESTFETGLPTILPVGGDILPGLKEALSMMKVGEKWKLYLPSNLGYGTHTGHGRIPPNSNLIYILEILRKLK